MKFRTITFLLVCCSLSFVRADQASLPTPCILPERVYGLANNPCVIRLDTLVFAPVKGSLLYDLENGPGAQYNDYILWHPRSMNNDGAFQIGIYSGYTFAELDHASSRFVFCNPENIKSTGSIHWLPIGDSLTVPGHYIEQTIETLTKIAPQIKLSSVGSQTPRNSDSPKHEGRGGWSWIRYLEAFPPASRFTSPFVFGQNGAVDFDFNRYLNETMAGKPPQVITLFLGANDVYGISSDFSMEKVNLIIERSSRMVAMIREAAPDSAIGIIPPPPPSEQNGFGTNYRSGVTEWQYRRALQHYIAGLLQEFDGRWDEGIYIIPGFLHFDPETAYPMASNRSQNALHPTREGFLPMSNAISAWLIHLLSEELITPGL